MRLRRQRRHLAAVSRFAYHLEFSRFLQRFPQQ